MHDFYFFLSLTLHERVDIITSNYASECDEGAKIINSNNKIGSGKKKKKKKKEWINVLRTQSL